MWGNFVDTQANTLTYKATYLKKKKKKRSKIQQEKIHYF